MTNALDQALAHWGRGFNVLAVPLPDARHDGKAPATVKTCKTAGCHPIIEWKPWERTRQTEADVRAMFDAGEWNVGVITGATSGVVVVDVDASDAVPWAVERLTYTPWQTRTAKGYHLYYAHPGCHVANRARLHTINGRVAIDVRGDGGYVVAPGSLHASGARYVEAGDWSVPRERLPRFWPGWIARPTPKVNATVHVRRPAGDVVERARKYLASIPRPEIGAGSDEQTFYAAARLVRGFDVSESDAVALIWEWAGGRPGWTEDWCAGKVRAAARYATEPIGGLLG